MLKLVIYLWYVEFQDGCKDPYLCIITSPWVYAGPVNVMEYSSCDCYIIWQRWRDSAIVIKVLNQLTLGELIKKMNCSGPDLIRWAIQSEFRPFWKLDPDVDPSPQGPVEEKGQCSHTLKRRAPRPLPGQAFIVFLGPLHQRWSSFTMHRFVLGGYLLQTTKERMLLNTSKKDICNVKGEVVVKPVMFIPGRSSSDFRKIKILSKHLLPQGEGVLARASLRAV